MPAECGEAGNLSLASFMRPNRVEGNRSHIPLSTSRLPESISVQPILPRRRRKDLFADSSTGFIAHEIEPDRPFWSAILPRWVPRAGGFVALPLVSARLLHIGRELVGVTQGSSPLLVTKVSGRPRTAAAFTGVPFRIARIGLVLLRDLRVGSEARGTNGKDSQRADKAKVVGVTPDTWDGVGGSGERQWNSAPLSVTETTLPEPSSTKRPFRGS